MAGSIPLRAHVHIVVPWRVGEATDLCFSLMSTFLSFSLSSPLTLRPSKKNTETPTIPTYTEKTRLHMLGITLLLLCYVEENFLIMETFRWDGSGTSAHRMSGCVKKQVRKHHFTMDWTQEGNRSMKSKHTQKKILPLLLIDVPFVSWITSLPLQ